VLKMLNMPICMVVKLRLYVIYGIMCYFGIEDYPLNYTCMYVLIIFYSL